MQRASQKIFFVTLFIFTCLITLSAQQEETTFGYSGLKLTGIWGGPSFGWASVSEEYVFMRGGFGGLEFNKNLFIGYASYWLDDRIQIPEYPGQNLDFEYKGAILSYAFKPSKVVHPKLSCFVGGGRIDVPDLEEDRVFVLQPTAGIELNIFKWWHIDVLGGYRMVANTDLPNLSDQTMSGFQAEINLRFGISWGWK